jgi:hypothetical protein
MQPTRSLPLRRRGCFTHFQLYTYVAKPAPQTVAYQVRAALKALPNRTQSIAGTQLISRGARI